MKKFEYPEVELTKFQAEDVITASNGGNGEDNTGDDNF